MSKDLIIKNPGQNINIGSKDHLTQIQHKKDCVEIVDHFDKGDRPAPIHTVVRINSNGGIDFKIC